MMIINIISESYELYEKSIATDATSLAESLSADLKVH